MVLGFGVWWVKGGGRAHASGVFHLFGVGQGEGSVGGASQGMSGRQTLFFEGEASETLGS